MQPVARSTRDRNYYPCDNRTCDTCKVKFRRILDLPADDINTAAEDTCLVGYFLRVRLRNQTARNYRPNIAGISGPPIQLVLSYQSL